MDTITVLQVSPFVQAAAEPSLAAAVDLLRDQYQREMLSRKHYGYRVETFAEWVRGIVMDRRGITGEDAGAVADWIDR